MVVFKQRWLFSSKTGCIGERGCNRAKVVVFGQSGSIRVEVVVFRQSG